MAQFTCTHTYSDGTRSTWTGTAKLLRKIGDFAEIQISGRGTSLLVLVGKYSWGRFICIPAINVGCPLSRWDDTFWNTERLSGLMNETDSVTVAHGIKAIMSKLPVKE